jgi:hypothetical protein
MSNKIADASDISNTVELNDTALMLETKRTPTQGDNKI